MVGAGSFVGQPDTMSEALDSQLKFTESGGNWWIASGPSDEYYYDCDAAQSEYYLGNYEESCLQAIVDSDSSQTVKFYWKVSSHQGYDYLQFYIDSTLKDQISGEVDWPAAPTRPLASFGRRKGGGGWQQKSYAVSAGIHILKWRGACPESFEGSRMAPASPPATTAAGWTLPPAPQGPVQFMASVTARRSLPIDNRKLVLSPFGCAQGKLRRRIESPKYGHPCPHGMRLV